MSGRHLRMKRRKSRSKGTRSVVVVELGANGVLPGERLARGTTAEEDGVGTLLVHEFTDRILVHPAEWLRP